MQATTAQPGFSVSSTGQAVRLRSDVGPAAKVLAVAWAAGSPSGALHSKAASLSRAAQLGLPEDLRGAGAHKRQEIWAR